MCPGGRKEVPSRTSVQVEQARGNSILDNFRVPCQTHVLLPGFAQTDSSSLKSDPHICLCKVERLLELFCISEHNFGIACGCCDSWFVSGLAVL